jgi:hypothetical protein
MTDYIAPDGRVYPTTMPKELPPRQVLVHNHVTPDPGMRQGRLGARYWLQELDDALDRCDCGWAAQFLEHYRVKLPA